MEINKNAIIELEKTWKTLCSEVKKSKKLKFEIFKETFSQTYALLVECAAEKNVDKQLARVIAEAYLFANINDDSLESVCQAAIVLTERMLNHLAFSEVVDGADVSKVYVLEFRDEVQLNFRDIDESISALANVYDAYWKKFNK